VREETREEKNQKKISKRRVETIFLKENNSPAKKNEENKEKRGGKT